MFSFYKASHSMLPEGFMSVNPTTPRPCQIPVRPIQIFVMRGDRPASSSAIVINSFKFYLKSSRYIYNIYVLNIIRFFT